jgi:hypothetical protein
MFVQTQYAAKNILPIQILTVSLRSTVPAKPLNNAQIGGSFYFYIVMKVNLFPVSRFFLQKIFAVRKSVVLLRRQHSPSLLTMLKSAGRFFLYRYGSQLY